MFVRNLKVNNFQGLSGVHEFQFEKITALAQPNGTGKTSLINALRFGLTGVDPKGEVVTKGTPSTAVRIEFDNGNSFTRQKYAEKGKSSKFFVGNAQTTLSKLNDFITNELGGVDINTAKVISSGELLTSMTSQQFGELLLQYLPESMTVDTIISRFPAANDEQKEIIKKYLPGDEFEVSKINEFYQLITEHRKLIKQKLTQQEAVLASLGNEAPTYTSQGLTEEIEKLIKQRDELVALEANARFYQQVENQIKQRDEQVALLDNQIKELEVASIESREASLLEDQIKDVQNQMANIHSVLSVFVKVKTAIDKVSTKVSESDKNELLKAANGLVPMYKKQRERFVSLKEKVKQLTDKKAEAWKYAEVQKNNQIEEKRKLREQLANQELKLPEKPEFTGSVSELNQELSRLQSLIPIVENYNKKDQLEESIANLNKKYADYDGLVVAFSPKGEVKEAITSYYMEEFSEPCNLKAKELFGGMSLKFINDKGVKVLTDPNGSGNYLEFSSLSGGEQASVMFLLINMLTSLSGMGIIILDELSVLDKEVFENLINVLLKNQSEYDMCLIATVDHDDTLKTLKKHNISILSVNGYEHNTSNALSDEVQNETKVINEEDDLAEEVNGLIEVEDKASMISNLKDLVDKTIIETADMRFEEEKEDPKSLDELLEGLDLSSKKSKKIVEYIINNTDNDNEFLGTAKDMKDLLDISQPTIGSVLKVLQEAELITLLKRGLWEVSETLVSFKQ